MDLLMVNLAKRGYQKIGEVNKSEDVEDAIRRYCFQYIKELKEGDSIFAAIKIASQYEARMRAIYASWKEDVEDEDPFYIDVAESDERIMFHRTVNFSKHEKYDCIVCHKEMLTEDCNIICEDCLENI